MRSASLFIALSTLSFTNAAFRNSWTPNTEANVPSAGHNAFGEVNLPLEGGGEPSQSFHSYPLGDYDGYSSYGLQHQPFPGAFDLPPSSFGVHDYSMYGSGLSEYNVHGDMTEHYQMPPPPPAEMYEGQAMYGAQAEERSSTMLDPTQSWHQQGNLGMYAYPEQDHVYPMSYDLPPQPITLHERMIGQVDAFDRLDLGDMVSLPRIQTGVEHGQGSGSSTSRVAPQPRRRERVQPQTARVSRAAPLQGDTLEAPATSRTAQKFEKRAKSQRWVIDEWARRGITWLLPAQELAARVTEIKIDHPNKVASIGHYSGDFVQHDSGKDFKYKYAYHRWSLTYYNKVSNLKRSFGDKKLNLTPEQLRKALLQHFRDVVPRHHAMRADQTEENKNIVQSHAVWDQFMLERMQPALDAGEVFSMPLLATLAHGFLFANLTHEDTIRFLKTYLLNVMDLPPHDLEEFRTYLQMQREGTSKPGKKPPRGRRL